MSLIQVPGLEEFQTSGLCYRVAGSPITIVNDFQYKDDFELHRPFSDSESSLLSQCFGDRGIPLSSCSVHYVLSGFNTQFGINKYWDQKKGFTTAGWAEVDKLRNSLQDDSSNVILAIGPMACLALTGQPSVSKYRGSILPDILGLNKKVIPTLSVKTAIRQYLWRYYIQADIRKLIDQSKFPDIRRPQRNLIICPSYVQVMNYLDRIILYESKVAFDIETARGQVSCISFAITPDDAISIPFYDTWTVEEEAEIWRHIACILGNPDIEKVLQNGMFDMFFLLFKMGIITRGYVHDTMIKQNLNYPDFPKGLAFITSIYTDEPYYKDEGKTWFQDMKLGKGDISQFYVYNAKDSCVTLEADQPISAELIKYGNQETYDFSRRLFDPLMFMQLRGIKVDMDKLKKVRGEASEKLRELQGQLNALAGCELNVNSQKQCIDYFYGKKGYPQQTNKKRDKATGTRKQVVTCDDKAMKRIARKYNCEEAKLVKQIRALRKLISTYLDMKFDADGRLRCSFSIGRTNSGRLSSSESIFDTGGNSQNLPKSFREFLVADEGYICAEIDLTQAEWVATAYISGDANMIEAVEKRLDAHIHTGHMMFRAPKDLIELENNLLGSETDESVIKEVRLSKCPDILQYNPLSDMSIRQAGKKCNHSFNYGLSPNGFALQYMMETKDAKRCYSLYHGAYPSLHIWHQFVRYQLGKDRTLSNLFGRKRRFLDRWGEDLFKAGYSYNPQSTVGQLLNKAIVATYEDQSLPGHHYLRPIEQLNQVHDSLWIQCPISRLHDFVKALKFIKRVLNQPLVCNGREFSLRCDCKVGFNFRFSGVTDANGKKLAEVELEQTDYEVYKDIENIIRCYTNDTTIDDLIQENENEEEEFSEEIMEA